MRHLKALAALSVVACLVSALALAQAKKPGGGSSGSSGAITITGVSAGSSAITIPPGTLIRAAGTTTLELNTGVAKFAAGTILYADRIQTTGNGTLPLYGQTADASNAVGISLASGGAYSTTGAKLVSIVNYTTEKAYFGLDGALTISGVASGSSALTLGSGNRITFGDSTVQSTAGGIGYGAYASRPTSNTGTKLYVATDSPVAQWVDTGSAWAPLVLGQAVGVQPPAAASFTVVNSSTQTLTDYKGTLLFTGPNDGTVTPTIRGYSISNSSTTGYIEAAIAFSGELQNGGSNNWGGGGIMMRESGTGKAVTLLITPYATGGSSTGGAWVIESANWTSNTGRTGTATWYINNVNQPIFLRIRRATTSVFGEWSTDRNTWYTLVTWTTTTVFTTAQDQVGIVGNGIGNTPTFTVLSFKQG